MLIPGGMHIHSLKKDDIILNAQQTEDLLRHGKTNGHARAYAEGTLSNKVIPIAPAHADGTDVTAEVDKLWDVFDRLVTKLEERVELYEKRSDNAYSLSGKNRYIDKALKTNAELLKSYQEAFKKYQTQADVVAKEVGISNDLKNKVQNGSISFEKLSEDDQKRVDAYSEWYDKIMEVSLAIEDLKDKQQELINQKLENVIDKYDTYRSTFTGLVDVLDAKLEYRDLTGGSILENSGTWNIVERQLKLQQSITNTYLDEMKDYREQMKLVEKEFGKGSKEYKEALASYRGIEEEYWNSKVAVEELTEKLKEFKDQVLQWKVDKFERAFDKITTFIELVQAVDYKDSHFGGLTEGAYNEAIKANDATIIALNEQRKKIQHDMLANDIYSEEYQEYAEQLAEIDQKIMDIGISNAELKQSIVELRFEPFYDAQDVLSDVITDFDILMGMIDSATYLNDDATFSEYGIANIALINKAMDATKQQIANYKEQLNNIQEMYDNNNITKEQYEEYTDDVMSGIQSASQALYKYNQQMLDMYEDQIKAENELLQDNIDLRVEALNRKEDYYDYDKTLKQKSRDINTLKAQIAALEGTNNAYSKARLEQLKEQLAESEEDLEETVHDHEVTLKEYGYDKLSEEADQSLQTTLDALKKNTDFQQAVINDMLDKVTAAYENSYSHIQQIIKDTGLMVSEAFDDYINAGSNFENNHVGNYNPDSSVSGVDTGHINAGDSVGNSSADNILNNVGDNNDTLDDAGKTNSDSKVVTSIKLSKTKVLLGVGQTTTVKVTCSPSNATNKDIVAESKNHNVATAVGGVEQVKITGRKAGNTTVSVIAASDRDSKAKNIQVYVLQYYSQNKQKVDKYLNATGISLSDEKKEQLLIKADKHTESNPNWVLGKLRENLSQEWYDGLRDRPDGTKNIPSGTSALARFFMEHGKSVNRYELQELADIYQIKTPGPENYEKWGSALKNQILNKFKSYNISFKKGGYVDFNRFIPLETISDLDKYYKSKGESGIAWLSRGEYVMDKQLTSLVSNVLPSALNTMQRFNELSEGLIANRVNNYSNIINRELGGNVDNSTTYNSPLIEVQGNVDKYVFKDMRELCNNLGKYMKSAGKKYGLK